MIFPPIDSKEQIKFNLSFSKIRLGFMVQREALFLINFIWNGFFLASSDEFKSIID